MATPDLTLVSEATLDPKLDSTLTSAKGYADTKKNEAITAAATDATTKANTAKAEAIEDATTKYGGLPKQVTDLTQGQQLLDPQLNNLTTLGRWRVINGSVATAANNHPFPGNISDIEVYPITSAGNGNIQQKVWASATFGGGVAVRTRYNDNWSEWDIYRTEEEILEKSKTVLDDAVVLGKQLLDPQLNNLEEFGRWRVINGTNATAENNHPFPGKSSEIEVYPITTKTSGNIQQKLWATATFGGGIAVRTRYSGNWSEWDIYRTEEEILSTVSTMISDAVPASATRTFPITLSFPGSTNLDTRTSVQARVPVKFAATPIRWRLHLRNRNDRTGGLYTGALSLTGVGVGKHALTTTGELTGNFDGAPVSVSGAATTPANGDDWVSPWSTYPLEAYKEHLISYGYTCAAQDNHAGYGTAWTTDNADDVMVETPTGATLTVKPLLDVWIEAEFPADVPAMAYWDSSSGVGNGAKYPGRQSYANVHALANGLIPVIYAHSGSAMRIWNNSTFKDQKWASLSKPDGLFWGMGGNDISDAGDLATMQSRFYDAWPVITAATSTNVYLGTLTPRYGASNTPEFVALQQEYNAWLETLPGGATACWDRAERVTDPATGALFAKYTSLPDTVHLNEAGYARSQTAMAGSVVAAVARA